MKKSIFTILLFLIGTIIISSSRSMIKSNGAPVASTGAPKDMTCAKSGCHEGSMINTGEGQLNFTFNNGNHTFIAGKTYPITIELKQKDIHRFGFQLVAINDADSSNSGNITITDALRTQIFQGVKQNSDRQYVTYKYLGTEQVDNGVGRWTFNWTAPKNIAGNITFYYGAIAANNDGTDSGDWVYHQKTQISPQN